MKTLYLIRHAKSSWDNSAQTDFERTLNERGEHDAPLMGKILKDKNINPDLIISSPAARAFTTAERFADQLNYQTSQITIDSRIYEATMRDLTDVVREIKDIHDCVLLFGHNPGISSFSNLLSDKHVGGMPTCSVVGLELNISSWREVERHCGKLVMFEYPKKNT